MPYPNEHSARMNEPGKYDTFARKNIAPGLDIILGIKDGKSETQAYRFNKDKFTAEEARKWLDDHKEKPLSFEPAASPDEKKMSDEYCPAVDFSDKLFSLDDKVIMRAGKWNGVEIKEQDLDDMVKAFSEIKKDIPLKLGHDSKQEILQKDGYPAAGWVASLKRSGDKLVASFRDIPRAVKELIDNKAYNQVSAEIAFNYSDNGKKYPRFLKGVALLGVDLPAVSGLGDFLALYSDESQKTVNINFTDLTKEEGQMDELKKLQDEVAAKDKLIAEQQAQLKTFTDAAEKAAADKLVADAESRKQEIKTFIDAQKKEGRVIPAHESMIQAIMESLDDAKTVKFADAEGKEQEIGVRKHFENFIAALPKIVDFSTNTVEGEKVEEFAAKPEEAAGDVNGQKLHFFANGLMKKNDKMSYADAYKQAKKDHPELCAANA